MARLSNTARVVMAVCLAGVACFAEETAILPRQNAPRWNPPATETERFNWSGALNQSFFLLTLQHSVRLTETRTFAELKGPFLADYGRSVKGFGGWDDGDAGFVNYVAHPAQGAASGYIQVQNDPDGRTLNIADGGPYWKSRLKAMAWSAAYSLQFELGPYSEASLGNVGSTAGKMGFVDLVVTPVGGVSLMVAEDLLDHYVVRPIEGRFSPAVSAFLRVALSPTRSFANLLRFRKPWRRDNRDRFPRIAKNPSDRLQPANN